MPRDRRSTDREAGRDLPSRQFTRPQVREDLTSSRVGERPKDTCLVICHPRYLATEQIRWQIPWLCSDRMELVEISNRA